MNMTVNMIEKRMGFNMLTHAEKFQAEITGSTLSELNDIFVVTYAAERTEIEIGVDSKGRVEGYRIDKVIKNEVVTVLVQKIKMIDGKMQAFGATQNAKEFATEASAETYKQARIAKIVK